MLDFNTAEQMKENSGVIPTDSIVILEMHLSQPLPDKQGSHALLSRSGKGNEYLSCTFKVVRGCFEGKTIYEFYTVAGNETAAKISMRTLRAIIESARGIDPNDASPAATAARRLNDWSEFQSVQFMAKVKAEWEENKGEMYLNNHIKYPITPDKEEYGIVATQGEIITNNPLPEKPATVAKPAAAAPAWGGAAAAAASAVPAASTGGAPAWARK